MRICIHSRRRAATLLGALGLGLALTLAACGGEGSGDDTVAQVSTTEHNDADVTFASEMIQHHAQALEMVDMTLDRPLDPEVQKLTDEIRDAQGPEIETMSGWLQEWGEEVPETVRDHTNMGHDVDPAESMEGMGHSDMPGMMTAEDMTSLQNATDAEFQNMWLEMMVAHHEGAVEMAETEQSEGRYEPTVDLAGTIIETQTAEIETMEDLIE